MSETSAPMVPNSPEAIRAALVEAWLGLNYLLDAMHAINTRDEAITAPIFAALKELVPDICKIEVYPTLGMRHVESIGDCARCGAAINWHEPVERRPGGTQLHYPKCPPPVAP